MFLQNQQTKSLKIRKRRHSLNTLYRFRNENSFTGSQEWLEIRPKTGLDIFLVYLEDDMTVDTDPIPHHTWLPNVTEDNVTQGELYMKYLNDYQAPPWIHQTLEFFPMLGARFFVELLIDFEKQDILF